MSDTDLEDAVVESIRTRANDRERGVDEEDEKSRESPLQNANARRRANAEFYDSIEDGRHGADTGGRGDAHEQTRNGRDVGGGRKVAKGNDLKTNMGNERTFFKWMFTGLHVGTASTWVLKFFAEPGPSELWMALFAWIVAFAIVGYGLAGYYRRRRAIFDGKSVSEAESPTAVVLVALASTLTMGGIILYSVVSIESAY
uniref:DUF202 domain-containing protein n=1 Tax=Erythrolobus australicus TaxID=1077150 RepID=A0A6T5VQV8_9RHOD